MKICILTAGKGSRIGSLCKNINKALLPIDHKAIISQIIEKFDKDTPNQIESGLGDESDQDTNQHLRQGKELNVSKFAQQKDGRSAGIWKTEHKNLIQKTLRMNFINKKNFMIFSVD